MPLTTGQQTIVGLEAQDGATIAGLDDALYTQEFDLGLITITQDLADQSVVSASLTAYDAALTAQIDGTSPFTPITFSLINPVGGICYLRGTHIATPSGDVKIEDLKVGDPVLTLGQGVQPIKWIGRRRMDISSHPRPERAAPIRIRRDAFADSVPQRDLLVSPDHAIYVDGILVCARTLVNGATIVQQLGLGDVEYLHVELDQHAVLLAEGLGAESYLDTGNRGFFSNAGVPTVLHPDMSGETGQALRVAASCAPFVDDPDVIRPVWQALADRACALGAKRRALPTTNDPNLFLIADGQVLRPISQSAGLHTFCLPAGITSLRLVSRATAPSAIRPWISDDRSLGVAVSRIVVLDETDRQIVPMDHPLLTNGWWDAETDGTTTWRWTTGNAELPIPATGQACVLEIRVQIGGTYLLEAAVGSHRIAA